MDTDRMETFDIDRLHVRIYPTRAEMGMAAGFEAAASLRRILQERDTANVIFAAAPSQNEFLASLLAAPDVAWHKVHAFHMDEYIGLSPDAPQQFATFLRTRLFNHLPFASVECLNGSAADPQKECLRYAALLAERPPDIVCMGIGENGHIAFNDPPLASFNDSLPVRIVELEESCRLQQVNDGCFPGLADVPTHAMTLTIPALLAATAIFCMVPGPTKAEAIRATLEGPVTEAVPASILRTHPVAVLFLDTESAKHLCQTPE